jgi:uncharacterized protein YoxC
MEFLQAVFYILWIVFLLGLIMLVITALAFLAHIKKKADETMDYVKKQSDDVRSKVEGFVDLKKNEIFMKGAGFIASSVMNKIKKKK